MKIKDKKQIKALEDHGKQLLKNSLSTHSKQKEIFEELSHKRMGEIQDSC